MTMGHNKDTSLGKDPIFANYTQKQNKKMGPVPKNLQSKYDPDGRDGCRENRRKE